MANLLFVYGTLRPGRERWPVLRPFAASWADAEAKGRVWDTGRGYPAAVFGPGGRVRGTAVTLDDDQAAEALTLLDHIEAEGRLFRRRRIRTSAGPALAYEWLGSAPP